MENLALTESTYYILLSLYHPQHGYGIMQQTEQLSGGRVHLAAGTRMATVFLRCTTPTVPCTVSSLTARAAVLRKPSACAKTGLWGRIAATATNIEP